MPRQLLNRRPSRARYQADRTVAGFTAGLGDAVDAGAVRAGLLAVVNGAGGDACLSVRAAGVRP
jgi:hypothetical protein